MVDLTTEFAGIILKNPVITASGTFGYGEEFGQLIDLNHIRHKLILRYLVEQ